MAVQVYFIGAGMEYEINALPGAKATVNPKFAGILPEILPGAELAGINKYTHQANIIFLPGLLNQTQMAFMQSTHGRYKAY